MTHDNNTHRLKNTKNIEKLSILQINSSNADFHTKRHELLAVIKDNDPDVTIISEANTELSNLQRTNERSILFKEYNLENKVINSQHKSRICIAIRKGIPYIRCSELESSNNSTIVLRFKENQLKSLYLIGSYREWRHFGAPDATSTEGIKLQIMRLTQLESLIWTFKTGILRQTSQNRKQF